MKTQRYQTAWVAGLVLAGLVAAALAQPVAPGVETPEPEMKWVDFFVFKGGYITYGLLFLSLVAIALTIEHALSIRRKTIVPPPVLSVLEELIGQRKYVDAIRFAEEDPSMLGRVVHAGLMEASNGYAAMERALEETLDERAARLVRKIEYLNVIGNVSPMIGLFGTVYGLILLFADIHQYGQFPPPQIVADRMSIALLTTFWGLIVAIWSLSAFAILRNRLDVLAAECALVAEHLLSVFKHGPGQAAAGGVSTGGTRPQPARVSS